MADPIWTQTDLLVGWSRRSLYLALAVVGLLGAAARVALIAAVSTLSGAAIVLASLLYDDR